MDEIAFLDATELTRRLREGALRSSELLERYIERIERLDGPINAVVTRDFERARAEAQAADAELARGQSDKPLLGLPMTIKDTFEVAGLRTTSGAPILKDYVPTTTATAVALLQAAGAIVIGKTNTPLFAGDGQTYNELFGTTNNPWDVSRTPAGSSGGAAAALAAGLTPLELGSDIGGSIRNPAHSCGVFGHKPTWGVVPSRGHIPGPPGQLSQADLAVIGPLARSARDLRLAFDVLTSEVRTRESGWQAGLREPPLGDVSQLRVAAWLDDPFSPVDAGYRGVLEAAASALEGAGAKVDRSARPEVDFAASYETYALMLHSVLATGMPEPVIAAMGQTAAGLDPDDRSQRALQARGSVLAHTEWLRRHEMREQLKAAWVRFFADFDVVLLPVHLNVAHPHTQDPDFHARTIEVNGEARPYLDLLHWVSLATLPGLPSSVAPVGSVGGLPAGIQVVGAPFADRTTIAVAGWLGELREGPGIPPDFA